MQKHLDLNIIKPLRTTVFSADNIEKAFRFLASGKHMGKVLIKIRERENDVDTIPIDVKRQVFFGEDKSCVIVGGLGGFGLELADWMVIRGCRNLVMSSSRGITNGYQAARIK
jgi:fatty acid synthase, animal type